MESTKTSGLSNKDDDREQEEILLMPYNYYRLQLPTSYKDRTEELFRAFNYWINVPEDKLKHIEDASHTIMFACLLLDDIEDNGKLRKGIPVAHSIYGIASTINARNIAFFNSLKKLTALNHPEAVVIFIDGLLMAHRGQGMEIYWRDNQICPSEEEYLEMAENKNLGFILMPVRLMQLCCDNKQDFTKLAKLFILYFQIRNDYKNLHPRVKVPNESFCDDLTEGKFSFPLMHAITNTSAETKSLLMDILKQKTTDMAVKKNCIDLLERCGSFEYTRNKLVALKKEIFEEIANFGSNEFLEKVVNAGLY